MLEKFILKEKIKKMKKSTKIIIGTIILVVLGFVLNPFYWLMQPKERPKQPELSKEEIVLFQKLKSTYNCELERFYYNYTPKGNDTLHEKKYDKVPFEYSIAIREPKNEPTDDLIYEIGLSIKNDILKRNKFLQKIIIYRNFKSYEYLYDYKKDSLVLQP
jgi:hypothetical protein